MRKNIFIYLIDFVKWATSYFKSRSLSLLFVTASIASVFALVTTLITYIDLNLIAPSGVQWFFDYIAPRDFILQLTAITFIKTTGWVIYLTRYVFDRAGI